MLIISASAGRLVSQVFRLPLRLSGHLPFTTRRLRNFDRLRDEHGYRGGITIVKDYVRAHRLRHREVFVPLRHDPGHAQVDFGEALAEIAGVERKIRFFAMDLPHSDACFVQA